MQNPPKTFPFITETENLWGNCFEQQQAVTVHVQSSERPSLLRRGEGIAVLVRLPAAVQLLIQPLPIRLLLLFHLVHEEEIPLLNRSFPKITWHPARGIITIEL